MKTRKRLQFSFTPYVQYVSRSMVRAVLCLAVCMLGLGLFASANDHAPKIITFDAPGAGTAVYQGTFVSGINAVGAIVGWYVDGYYAGHGFVRWPDGKITTLDEPDAVNFDGFPFPVCTEPCVSTVAYGMNTRGVITGGYIDAEHEALHGFIRTPDGKYTSFDDPQASSGLTFQGTVGYNIDDSGTISGVYSDSNNVSHVFLRSPRGEFTSFDVPGAAGIGTPDFYGLSPRGTITGSYTDENGYYPETHGYVRTPDGTLTTFDDPNAGIYLNCHGGAEVGPNVPLSKSLRPPA